MGGLGGCPGTDCVVEARVYALTQRMLRRFTALPLCVREKWLLKLSDEWASNRGQAPDVFDRDSIDVPAQLEKKVFLDTTNASIYRSTT